MGELTVTIENGVGGVTAQEWNAIFPHACDPLNLVHWTQEAGMDGFAFSSIIVRQQSQIVLLVPMFTVRLAISALLDGMLGRIVHRASAVVPGLLTPKILGIGIIEGEWGQLGVIAGLDENLRDSALALARQMLEQHARDVRAALTVFLNFTPEAVASLPAKWANSLHRIDTIPCARLPIDFSTPEQYLERLSKNARKDIRRKLKSASDVQCIIAADAAPHSTAIYDLYRQTLARADLSLGVQRHKFFAGVCQHVPGSFYMLYLKDHKLIAFNLLLERDGMLIDKYFCMDEQAGREHSLYFVSWYRNIEYCCEKKLATYHAGPGAEATKARLGASFIPSITLFSHRNPLIHFALRKLKSLISYRPNVALGPDNIICVVNHGPKPNPLQI